MLFNLKSLFLGEIQSLPIDCVLDFSGVEFQNEHPFPKPVKVEGAVTASADIVTLHAKVRLEYNGTCDRCLTEFERPTEVPMKHILVTSLNNEDSDEFILLENYQLKLDELVAEDLILSLPSKHLCRKDCRGLCPTCGKNLNEGLCGCHKETVDPRLEALRQFLS